jgi:hypothetical protein
MDVLSLIPSVLAYDPETGLLTWKVNRGPAKMGSVAGYVHSDQGGKTYRRVKICGKRYFAHVLACVIMTGKWPNDEIDHSDGDGLNNRWTNLKDVTSQVNCQNKRKYVSNSSGCTGVYWDVTHRVWTAKIRVLGRLISLGSYRHKLDAVEARRKAEKKYGFHENHGTDRPL